MSPGPTTEESASPNIAQERYGFPKQGKYSLSYWLQGVQRDPLLNYRSTPEFPSSVDIVVIGSGMTGTLVAKHCIETWPEKSVVVLEAREFCSGATGRNAGHCKPDQWRGFTDYEKTFGTEQALKILENEQQTWSALVKYVQENNIDCDLWVGDTLDVPVTPEVADATKKNFERFKAVGGKVDHIKVTHDPPIAAEISRIRDALACYAWPASTLYPWKLTAHIMRENLEKGVNLQTRTKVTSVIGSPKYPEKWVVKSERGDIECSHVVHATNAYSSALEPSLRGLISPSPHMCDRIVPPVTFVGSASLENSYGVLLPDGGLFSINPRSTAEGSVLFGGSNPGQREFEQWLQEHPERCIDDGMLGFESVTKAVQTFAESQIVGWNAKFIDHSWSGIIALSADGVPFVGQLPGLSGQWVCAGHHGHGMARIFTAAPGLVKLMSGSSWAETKLPEVFQLTRSRISRLTKLFKKEERIEVHPRL
ncbi:FAD dependent oxidoreductase [Aspergillus cavernicola]|uniref:FAD dependent oxidoreductase n=1 Tax=Aspergillus cavernicola TaxID=176166 RepID=A0ABR4IB98_9EURO